MTLSVLAMPACRAKAKQHPVCVGETSVKHKGTLLEITDIEKEAKRAGKKAIVVGEVCGMHRHTHQG